MTHVQVSRVSQQFARVCRTSFFCVCHRPKHSW